MCLVYDGSDASSLLRPGDQLGRSRTSGLYLIPLHPASRFDVRSLRGGVTIHRPLGGLGISPNIRTVVVALLSVCPPRPSAYEADLEGTGRTQLYRPLHFPCINSRVAASCSLTSSRIFLLISMFSCLFSSAFVRAKSVEPRRTHRNHSDEVFSPFSLR